MTPPLAPEIDSLIDSFVENPEGLVGLAAIAVDHQGRTIYSGAGGKTSANPSKAAPVTLDTVFWIGELRTNLWSLPRGPHLSVKYFSQSNENYDSSGSHAVC